MTDKKIFYYHFNPFNFWLLLNCFISYILLCCAFKYTYCCRWSEFYVLCGLMIVSWGLWIFKHLMKQVLAVITDESIKIDHCNPLPWKKIKNAEERIVHCFFKKFKVIILVPKKGIKYKYNFLQKHNGEFSPFSLPLYPVITKEEASELKKIISSKVKYISLPEETSNDELLAERIHEIWSRWFLHYSKNATPQNMRRWTRLAKTPYNKLPEEEKEKDRKILRELLKKKK